MIALLLALSGWQISAQTATQVVKIAETKSEKCVAESGGVTSKMLDCATEDLKAADIELNTQYQTTMKSKTKFQQNALKKAQKAWVKFRGAECDYYADPEAGTGAALDIKGCLLSMTRQRLQELKKL